MSGEPAVEQVVFCEKERCPDPPTDGSKLCSAHQRHRSMSGMQLDVGSVFCHGACQGQIIDSWCDRHRRHDLAIAQASTPKGTPLSASSAQKPGAFSSLVDNLAGPEPPLELPASAASVAETAAADAAVVLNPDSGLEPTPAESVLPLQPQRRKYGRERTPSLVAMMMQKHQLQQLRALRQSGPGSEDLVQALQVEAGAKEVAVDPRQPGSTVVAGGFELFEEYLEAVHKINAELEPHKAAEQIIQQSCYLLKCARATIFYVDHQELILVIAKGARNIRLPKTKGIAGWVATTGETLNIMDAWQDKRFDNTSDLATGFRTASVLATPVVDDEGNIVAVLQCINKQPDPVSGGSTAAAGEEQKDAPIAATFTEDDEILIKNLARHCSTALRNAELYQQSKRSEAKVSAVLEIVEMLHAPATIHNTNTLIFTISHRANQIVEADRCTLYLADTGRQQLVVMQGDVDIRFPWTKGLAGNCCTTGQIINIRDCYLDDRFNQEVDKSTGYRTRSMLCLPIFAEDQKTCIGVLQLINRLDEEEFLQSDIAILKTLLTIAGPILHKSRFFTEGGRQQVAEHDRIKSSGGSRAKSPRAPPLAGIRE